MNQDKLIAAVISQYKSLTFPAEFEIRFRSITRETFAAIFDVLMKHESEYKRDAIEYSINTISQNVFERASNVQYIRQQKFALTGETLSDERVQKEKLTKPITINDYLSYNIVLSKESKSRPFATSQDALIRFKLRASFLHNVWRFDLTAVRQGIIKDFADKVRDIKTKLFVPRTFDNFVESLDVSLINSYEVEIEHVGDKTALTMDSLKVITNLFARLNPSYIIDTVYQDEIFHIAQYIKSNKRIHYLFKEGKRLKDLANQAKSLNKYTYASELFPPVGYYISEKADGIRAFVSINGARCRILSDVLVEYTLADSKPGVTIADCELLRDGPKFTLYIFDVMVVFNDNISDKGFALRLDKFKSVADLITGFIAPHGGKCLPKKFIRLETDLKAAFESVYNAEYPYEIDGIIITSPNQSYEDTNNYKWKPYDKTTVDFVAVECPANELGRYPYLKRTGHKLYLLFNGIRYEEQTALGMDPLPFIRQLFPDTTPDWLPIQFAPSINPLAYIYYHPDDAVTIGERNFVELRRDREIKSALHYVDNGWIFTRIREDRKIEKNYYGNAYRVAEQTYMNYIDEFTLADLWNPIVGYFAKIKDNIFRSPNKFKRFVIGKIITENMSNAEWIIDLAAGRGADLVKYIDAGVKRAIFVDKDKSALAEIIKRKFELASSKNKKESHPLLMYIMEQDLSAPADAIAARIATFTKNELANAVVCNFAIHYFCTTPKTLKNFLTLVAKTVRVNGVFVYTTMDGAKVFTQMKQIKFGDRWIIKENGVVKYTIVKKYTADGRLLNTGQMIAVKLPLADDLYEEPLANIDYINKGLTALGFRIETNVSFADFDADFKKFAPTQIYDALTADDKTMIGLHQLVVARRIK